MKKMKKKIKKIENNAVPDKQRQQRERVADDVVDDRHSKQFPNFMALSKGEKLVFFESLHAARKNATVNGNKIKERFGTIHDEYLKYFGSVEDNEGGESFKDSSGFSGIKESVSNWQNRGSENNSTQSNRENEGSGNSSSQPDQTQTKCPKRKRPQDNNLAAVKKKSSSKFVTMLPKLKRRESSKAQKEERKSDTPTSNKSQFETLKSDEKEIFFSVLKEAQDNILKESPDKYCKIVFVENIVKNYEKANEATPTKTEVLGRKKPYVKRNIKENNNLRVKVDITSSENERIKKERLSKRKEEIIKSEKQRREGEKEKTKKGASTSTEKEERSTATERKPVTSTDGLGKKQQRRDSYIVTNRKIKENKKKKVNKQKKKDLMKGCQEECQNKRNKEEGKVLFKSKRSITKNPGGKKEKKNTVRSWRKIQIGKPKQKTERPIKRGRSLKSEKIEQNRQSAPVEEEKQEEKVTEEVKENSKSLGESLAETIEPPTETTEAKPIETFFFLYNFKSTEDFEDGVNEKTKKTKKSKIFGLRKKIQINKCKEKTRKPKKRKKSCKGEQEKKNKHSAVVEEDKHHGHGDSWSSGEDTMKIINPPTETAENVKTESIKTLFFLDEFKSTDDVEVEGKDRVKRNMPKNREGNPENEKVEQDRKSVLVEEDKQEKKMADEVKENSRSFREGTAETIEPPAETAKTKAQSIETFFFVVNFKSMDDVKDDVNDKTEETKGSDFRGARRKIQIDKEQVTEEMKEDSAASGEDMAETTETIGPTTETAETVQAEAQSIETFFFVDKFKSTDDVEDGVNDKTKETKENKNQPEDSLSYKSFRHELGEEVQCLKVESTDNEGATPMMIEKEITIEVEEDFSKTETPSSVKLGVRYEPEQTRSDVKQKRPTEKPKSLNLERRLEREDLAPVDPGDSFTKNGSSHIVTNDEDSVLQLWEDLKILKLSDSDCMMNTELLTAQTGTENISCSRFSFFPDQNFRHKIHLAEEKMIVIESEDKIQEEDGRPPEATVPDHHKKVGVIVVDSNAIEKIKNLVKALEKEAETKLEVKPDKENIINEYNQLLLDYTDYLTRLLYLLTN